ncbi:MAG: minichromosome maintenance protein MCM [Nanoarchaeota archaeon]
MELAEQIDKLQEFIETTYYSPLLENVRKGDKFLPVNFAELSKYSPELAEAFLEDPEELLKAGEHAISRFDIEADLKNFTLRIFNLNKEQHVKIRDIRSKHLGKFIQTEGIVRQKSDVRPQVTSAKFECPSCGNTINVLQLDTKFKEPSTCGCGRKGKFRLLSKELVDAQKIVIEEAPEDLEGGEQPKRLSVFLKNDLVSPISEKRTNPGSRIKITGIVKEVPIPSPDGGKLTRFDLIKEANYVEPVQEDFLSILISPEEVKDIKELAEDPRVYEKLVNSIAPTIYGHEKVKEALLLMLMSGVRKKRDDGAVIRGDIHVLLIGDPGSGKSQLLQRAAYIAPKSRLVSGKGASGAGLTASVVRDEFIRGYALEAGALVLANNGLCCLDELDKMSKEDRSAMHEALEQQQVTIAKANIQATLRCVTTVLAAANPKFGRFDPYEIIAKQIDLPSTLINRFDLIFPIKDIPEKDKDDKMASFILNLHQNIEANEPELDTPFMKKYISYAKQTCRPALTDTALEEIKAYYVKMRASGSEEGGKEFIRSIPISPRQLEALIRLSEASAKTRLSMKVTKKDAKRAIDLVHYCLAQVAFDPETGKIDIDRISTGIPATERSHIAIIRELIADLETRLGTKAVPVDDIVQEAGLKGINEEAVDEVLEKLKRAGDIFSPKSGIVSRI